MLKNSLLPKKGLLRASTTGSREISAVNLMAGFTLVELMVSISVLAVLGGLVAQLMSSTSRLTANSKQSSECDTEARYALSQISADLSRRVRRPDVDALVKKKAGNDEFFLFSETAGYAPNLTEAKDASKAKNRSTVSLIGYRIQPVQKGGITLMELQRYARALPWTSTSNDKALPFVSMSGSPAVPLPASTLAGTDGQGAGGSFPEVVNGVATEDIYYQPIAQNVVRFEVSVLYKPDMSDQAAPKQAFLLSDAKVVEEISRNGFSNISAIVVSLVILDAQSAVKTKQQDIDDLELEDSNPSDFPEYPADRWNAKFKEKLPKLPKHLASGIHFYQRVISL